MFTSHCVVVRSLALAASFLVCTDLLHGTSVAQVSATGAVQLTANLTQTAGIPGTIHFSSVQSNFKSLMAEADQKNFAYDMKQNPPDNLTATSGTATASAIYSLTNTSTVLNWSLTVSSAIGVPPAGSYIHAHAKNKASIYVRVKNDGSRPGAFKIQWVGSAGLSISGAPSDGYAKGWLDANFFVTSFAQDGSGSKSASWDKERIHTVAANQELTFSLIGFALEIDLADQAPAIASARPEHSREGRLLQGSSASACILPRREEDLLLYRPRRRSSTAA